MCARKIGPLLFTVWLIPFTAFTQEGPSDKYYVCTYVKPDISISKPVQPLPFSRINVIDCRFDTTKIGYLYTSSSTEKSAVCMQGSVESYVRSLLNKYYSDASSTNDKILACIRNFWIVDTGQYDASYVLNLRIEFYLNRQSCFYALYRFDSTFVLAGETESWAPLLNKMTMASTRKLYQVDQFNFQELFCYSARQIDSFNFVSRNIPILKAGFLRKGVYLNFSQFKRNHPAYAEFEKSYEHGETMIYVKAKNLTDSSSIEDAWGFCDGERLFIHFGTTFYRLFRSGDNFEFFAAGDGDRPLVFVLDMEKGKLLRR